MYSFDYIDNNIIINDKRIVLKYDQYNNIIVNNNIHKGIKKSISLNMMNIKDLYIRKN